MSRGRYCRQAMAAIVLVFFFSYALLVTFAEQRTIHFSKKTCSVWSDGLCRLNSTSFTIELASVSQCLAFCQGYSGCSAAAYDPGQKQCKSYVTSGDCPSETDTEFYSTDTQTLTGRVEKRFGLTYEATEGVWIWSESGNLTTYTNWGSGEPNNRGGENCVMYNSGKNYNWSDINCYTGYKPICEISTLYDG